MPIRILALVAAFAVPSAAQPEQILTTPTRSVVQVMAQSQCDTSYLGSGVVVEPGIVLTSAHVVLGTNEVKVILEGKTYYPSAHILAPELDLCLLRVPALPSPPVPRAADDAIKIGASVQAIGFPGGLHHTVTSGVLTERWQFRGSQLLQSDAAIHSGSSGGGLFTENGRLIGITTFAVLTHEGLNFCVPASCIPELLRRPWLSGTRIAQCRPRELFLQEFLDGMTQDPSNRPAWEAFSRAWVASRPRDPDAWYSLGHTLSKRASEGTADHFPDASLRETARQAYTKALELNPGHARAWNNLGVVQDELGESEAAIASFKMAVRVRNDFALAWLNLGSACINTRRYEEAAQALRCGLAQAPDEARSWARLAFCEEKLGNRDSAIRHLRIALALWPMHADWWLDLAQFCRSAKRQGEFETALGSLRDRLPTFAREISIRVNASAP